MVKYFYGEDSYGAREAIHQLAEAKKLPIRWVDREDLEVQSLLTILDQAGSGLFGGQLVIVRDASDFPKAIQEQIIETSIAKQPVDWIVWDRINPDKRSKLFTTLKKNSTEFPSLSPVDAAVWVQKEFRHVDAAAAQELARRCGADRWRMKNELEKLSLVYQPITKQAVEQEVPPADVVEEIFPFLDALAAGNVRRTIQLLEDLLLAGNSELYILSMLGYQFKTLLAIASGNTEGLHPFVIQKNIPAARRYSVASLQDILTRIAATDFMVKQGKVDQRTALSMLVLSLAQPTVQKNRP